MADFEQAKAALDEQYKQAVDARAAQLDRIAERLEQEITISLPTIKKAALPAAVKPSVLRPFAKLVVDDK